MKREEEKEGGRYGVGGVTNLEMVLKTSTTHP